MVPDGLVERGMTVAATESTSTYREPVCYCVEEVVEAGLPGTAHIEAVPGRRTDVHDAELVPQLLEHGVVRPSVVPPREIRLLRMLTRSGCS